MFLYLKNTSAYICFTEFVKWILPFCSNIHTLKLENIEIMDTSIFFPYREEMNVYNEIARLKKLKDLQITSSSYMMHLIPKEVTSVAFQTITTLFIPRRFLGTVDRWRYFGFVLI